MLSASTIVDSRWAANHQRGALANRRQRLLYHTLLRAGIVLAQALHQNYLRGVNQHARQRQ